MINILFYAITLFVAKQANSQRITCGFLSLCIIIFALFVAHNAETSGALDLFIDAVENICSVLLISFFTLGMRYGLENAWVRGLWVLFHKVFLILFMILRLFMLIKHLNALKALVARKTLVCDLRDKRGICWNHLFFFLLKDLFSNRREFCYSSFGVINMELSLQMHFVVGNWIEFDMASWTDNLPFFFFFYSIHEDSLKLILNDT